MSALPSPVAASTASPALAVVASTDAGAQANQPPTQPFAQVLQQKVSNKSDAPADGNKAAAAQSSQKTDGADADANAATTEAVAAETAAAPVNDLQALLPWMFHTTPESAAALLANKAHGVTDDKTKPVGDTASAADAANSAALAGIVPVANGPVVTASGPVAAKSDDTTTNDQAGTSLGDGGNNRPTLLPQTANTAANVAAADDAAAQPKSHTATDAPQAELGFEAALANARANQAPSNVHRDASAAQQSTVARLDAPVGTSAWNDQLGDRISWMSTQGGPSKAELILNPPHLGRIEVSVSVSGDQANATFVSHNPQVREALENAMGRLREVLADSGISLGQTQVGADSSGFWAQNQENGDNSSRGNGSAGMTANGGGVEGTGAISASLIRQGNGMLDVFA